jgi:3-oxochol-4-en-24-oyl-CoA dehydrogenase
VSIAATNEQLALQGAIRDWAGRAGTLLLVRAQEPDAKPEAAPDARYWDELASLGVFAIALPEEVGGAGGTVGDLAAALEELTLTLAPGPVLPAVLAGLVLAPAAGDARTRDFLAFLAEGEATATVVLPGERHSSPATAGSMGHSSVVAQRRPDGSLLVNGETGPVLSGGPGADIIASAAPDGEADAWFRVPDGHPGIAVTERDPVDFSRPVATIRFTNAVIVPGQLVPGITTDRAAALAAALFSVEAAAVARWSSETAAAYAKTREQFGRPIGSFQAIKHICANQLCRAEEAAALAWDAARAADEAPGEFPLAAAAAAAKALDAAVDNAKDCIQVLGGIGFTWEHDAHLYLRRALALRHLLGGAARWRERTAELALDGARRQLSLDVAGPAAEAARAVAGTVRQLPEEDRRQALAAEGYVAPHWPAPYGIGASPGDILAIDQELGKTGIVRPDLVIGGWAGQAVVQFGTPEQTERFVGPTVRGEIAWCQLFSEPGAGSDLSSLRTKATRTDGGWRLDGQKVWTSLAHEADWGICIARTDPDVPKHKGLTFFLVDMKSEGLDIRPLREMTGRAMFNEVFLDGVFVPDDRVLGRPGEGWRVARATLAAERVAMGRGSSFGEEVEGLLARVDAAGLTADRRVLEQLGELVSGALGGSLLDFRLALAQMSGTDNGNLAAIRKLLGVAHRQRVAETALALCGPEGAASDGTAGGPVYEFLLSRCLSIAGGTTQILLSVVAERVLGLPRQLSPGGTTPRTPRKEAH